MNPPDDETLLWRYAHKGDEAAFRLLTQRYGSLVFAACLRDVRHAQLAEDATQAVFLDLARKAKRVRVKTSLVPWLYAAARLTSRNVLRTERRRPTTSLDESIEAPSSSTDGALFQALDALSAPEREAVVLRFLQGMSLAEVGKAQGVSEDAVRMRVQRALKRLRAEYVPVVAAPIGLSERLALLALPKPFPLMTTPLFLIGGAVTLLTVAGAATTLHRPAPIVKPTVAVTKTPTIAKAVVQAKATAPVKPGKPLPKVAMLDRPFTLVYRLTITDARTDRMRTAAYTQRINELAKDLDADRIKKEDMDREVAEMTGPAPTRTEMITLASSDGKNLYYEDGPTAPTDRSRSFVNLFDGKQTYYFCYRAPGGKYGSQGDLVNGTVQYWTWNMPYTGPSVPLFPVTRGNELLYLSGFDKQPIYRDFGHVTMGPKGAVAKLMLGNSDLGDKVSLSGWKPLHQTVVAGTIVWVRNAHSDYFAKEDMGKPEWRFEYTLESVTTSADPTRFVPENLAVEGMDFTMSGHRAFLYAAKGGTLQQQIAKAGSR